MPKSIISHAAIFPDLSRDFDRKPSPGLRLAKHDCMTARPHY